MHELAFIVSPAEVSFFSSVICCLPADFVDIYVGILTQSKGNVYSLNSLSRPVYTNISKLRDKGYSVEPLAPESLSSYKYAVISRNFYFYTHFFDWSKLRHLIFATLVHATDDNFPSGNLAARLYIASSQRQARMREDSKFARGTHGFAQLMRLPREMRNEFAYSGPYHIGDWAEKRHCSRAHLRSMLEEKLGCALDARKPVVAFLLDEVSHLNQVGVALEQLALHVNLVCKIGLMPPPCGAYVWPEEGFAPNLLRFAAEYILAGYHSGTLASSTMLGLPVIPYYTPLTYEGGRGKRKKRLGGHKVYLPGNFTSDNICIDILDQLNPPVNLMDTSAILDRMDDTSWWTDYTARLPTAQKNTFGDYCIDGAASKTAALLVRAVTHGTFGEDADAVRLRPEYGTLVHYSAVEKGLDS